MALAGRGQGSEGYAGCMPRYFNTTGPCEAADHYMLLPEERIPDLLPFVEQKLYYVVHAARQTGKSTAMIAFAARLRELGYAAVYSSLEQCQGFDEVEQAEALWVRSLARRAAQQLPNTSTPSADSVIGAEPGSRLDLWLARLSELEVIPYRFGRIWPTGTASRLTPGRAEVHRKLKAMLDPDGIMNPGHSLHTAQG